VTVTVPATLLKRLERIAGQLGLSLPEVVELALRRMLPEYEKKRRALIFQGSSPNTAFPAQPPPNPGKPPEA